jgi:F-type H+-transporting ATPase subunit a
VEEPIWVTVIVNRLLGKPALALLNALHIAPTNPTYPIPNHVAMELLVFLLAVAFFSWLKGRISAERPDATQLTMEMLLTNPLGVGVQDLIDSNIGHGGEKYLPMIGSIGMFVLLCNLISVVPTLESPTANSSVPLGCAIVVFVYYNMVGIVRSGPLGHVKHFLGPKMPSPIMGLIMAPFMLLIETFSHLARLLSLTVRLWVNMVVSEILFALFLGLLLGVSLSIAKVSALGYGLMIFPLLIPMIFMGLHIFVAILQAFVFTILPVIYIAGVVGEEH